MKLLVAIVMGNIVRILKIHVQEENTQEDADRNIFICLIQTNTLYKNITNILRFVDFA